MPGAEAALFTLWLFYATSCLAACAIGAREAAGQARRAAGGTGVAVPPAITVLVPAFDEDQAIEACLASVRATVLRPAAVIVVDDGSRDATADLAARALSGQPAGRVIRLARNRGKAHALNVGLAAVATELVFTLDADTRLERETLARAVAALVSGHFDALACHVAIAPTTGIPAFQRVEYVSSLQLARLMQAQLGAVTTVPGAGGLYRTAALRAVGGFPARTRAEDTDLTLALQRVGGRVGCCAEAVVWTDPPETLAPLLRQRRRWIWGNLAASILHLLDRRPKPARFVSLILPWVIVSNGLSPVGFCAALLLTPVLLATAGNPAVGVGAALAAALAMGRCLVAYRIAGLPAPRITDMLGSILVLPLVNAAATASGLVSLLWRRAVPW